MEDALRLLENLILDNPDLERLEAIAGDFNPFVAMRWTHQELRHSAFTRWFLDPSESHGLGVYPLRSFLKTVVSAASGSENTPSLFDVDGWGLLQTRGFLEWERIDLLLRNDDERFVVVIENKVGTQEHSDQLARYRAVVESEFPGYRHVFVLMSPGGDQPSDDVYTSLSYSHFADLVDTVRERRGSQTSREVIDFLRHYSLMVRRHIVEDSEVQELCRRIYDTHRHALDLIFEHRPDRAQEVSDRIEQLVATRADPIMDQCSKSYIRFTTPVLDQLPKVGTGWTPSGRILLFEIQNYDDKVFLKLILGPGPEGIRSAIHQHVVEHRETFNRAHYKFYPKWWTFFGGKWLGAKQYNEYSLDEVEHLIAERVDSLFVDKIPRIEQILLPVIERLANEWRGQDGVRAG